ncbi:hypothetical protein T492DRAFT_291830 [Pavlovales sp. CCMP2436]|nr:hypothetical protein T492DRAFT_291830 [Pavlovales sp. CCMP2436]
MDRARARARGEGEGVGAGVGIGVGVVTGLGAGVSARPGLGAGCRSPTVAAAGCAAQPAASNSSNSSALRSDIAPRGLAHRGCRPCTGRPKSVSEWPKHSAVTNMDRVLRLATQRCGRPGEDLEGLILSSESVLIGCHRWPLRRCAARDLRTTSPTSRLSTSRHDPCPVTVPAL